MTRVTLLLLLGVIITLLTLASSDSPVMGAKSRGEGRRRRIVHLDFEGRTLVLSLEKDPHPTFTADATIEVEGVTRPLSAKEMRFARYTYTDERDETGEFGTVLLERDDEDEDNPRVLHAVIQTREYGLLHYDHILHGQQEAQQTGSQRQSLHRLLSSSPEEESTAVAPDEITPVPGKNVTRRTPSPTRDGGSVDNAMDRDGITVSDANTMIRFVPNCYPGDTLTRSAKVGIALDYGYAQTLDLTQTTYVQEVEKQIAVARVVNYAQLNLLLVVGYVVVGGATAPTPLNYSPSSGNCNADIGMALYSLSSWNQAYNANSRPAALWHLLTTCYSPPGVIGKAFLGATCDRRYGIGITSRTGSTWLTLAHEIGHILGSQHSFENGVGTTGGIMDYGDGRYNGVIQYHPGRRPDLCGELTDVMNNMICPELAVISSGPSSTTTCGNGVLEPDEDCECLVMGTTSCGACVSCSVPSSVQCTSGLFVLRNDDTPAIAMVDVDAVGSPSCCDANGRLAPPKTACGDDSVCAADGMCVPVCKRYALPSCGFDPSGCTQGCVFNSQCRYDILTRGPPSVPVSNVPAGASCFLPNAAGGGTGVCDGLGTCLTSAAYETSKTNSPSSPPSASDIGEGEDDPPVLISASPSSFPTSTNVIKHTPSPATPTSSSAPTNAPTLAPTPLPCPPATLFQKCPSAKSPSECTTPSGKIPKGCVWCKGHCQASWAVCSSSSASAVFSHCPPFVNGNNNNHAHGGGGGGKGSSKSNGKKSKKHKAKKSNHKRKNIR